MAWLSLVDDHARLRSLLQAAEEHLAVGEARRARAGFRAFRKAFERHVRVEEEILFPLFEVRVGLMGGPTVLMREEHRRMLEGVSAMAAAVEAADREVFCRARGLFAEIFNSHTAKEERFLYTTLERLLSFPEREALGERLLRA